MTRNRILPVVAVLALLFQTGCYTNLRVSFGNGTGQKIAVKDAQTGQEVQIAPGKFREGWSQPGRPHCNDARQNALRIHRGQIAHPAMDQKYYDPKKGVLGAWSFDLNVLLQTNMDLYVLLPGKKTVDANVPQPNGYPRPGKKMAD